MAGAIKSEKASSTPGYHITGRISFLTIQRKPYVWTRRECIGLVAELRGADC